MMHEMFYSSIKQNVNIAKIEYIIHRTNYLKNAHQDLDAPFS